MNNLRVIALVLAAAILVLMPSIAPGQTDKTQTENTQTDQPAPLNDTAADIHAARCQYAPAEESCPANTSEQPPGGKSDVTSPHAQIPRRMPAPPFPPHRPPMGRPGYGYPGYWAPTGERNHGGIGALIGLGAGVGLAVGAYSDPNKRVVGSLIFGGFGALIGAMVGRGIPSYHGHYYRRRWDYDSDEDASVGEHIKEHKRTTSQQLSGD